MNGILIAILVLGGIGLLASVILVIAAKLMHVPENENLKLVEQALPGANCGACGYAGCANYAKAVVENDAPVNLCIPGRDKTAREIAQVMGKSFEEVPDRKASVACQGSYEVTTDKYIYNGVNSCAAANTLHQGRASCPYGCLGLGDCADVCKFNAIIVENGVARVDPVNCTGCGVCTAACPNHLISLRPADQKSFVACRNLDRGNVTRKICQRGCIGCMRCEKGCPTGAIKVTDNCAIIDFDKCTDCGKCIETCPTHALESI